MSDTAVELGEHEEERPVNTVLVLNAGSSSLKFGVFWEPEETWVESGQISGIGSGPVFESDKSRPVPPVPWGATIDEALEIIIAWLASRAHTYDEIDAIGHRLVHGGRDFTSAVLVDDSVQAKLDALCDLAPLHMPGGLSVLRRMRAIMPDRSHVACFDTAFHATMPERAQRMAIPAALHAAGYRRYGFHGLSYESVVKDFLRVVGQLIPRRTIVAHLGNGASMCALLDGKSVATTMGYSTADGLVMATRTGSIDPGALIAFQRSAGMSPNEVEDVIYRKSGLLGLSGISGDMRTLLRSGSTAAREAIEHYCYWAARHAASLVCALGGLDALVFTGGVGENAAPIRKRIIEHLSWLGLACDDDANKNHGRRISPARSLVHVYVIASGEDSVIVDQVYEAICRRRAAGA